MNAKTVCIIPALNAERTIERVIYTLRRVIPDIYIIGIDDGSTDDTRFILEHHCDEMIAFDQNQGKGAALRAGFARTHASDALKAILTIDADGQHDPTFAPRLLEQLAEFDIVIGARAINTKTVPPHRRLANLLSSAATRLVTKTDIRDSQSGYRALKSEVVRKIHALGDRYEFETDFLVRAARSGYTIGDVTIPTIYGPESHFQTFKDAWRVTCTLWSHRRWVFR